MKRILVAIDGTGQKANDFTNVQAVAEQARMAGVTVIYRRGLDSVRREKLKGSGISGRGVNRQIRRLYQRVCAEYRPGDQLAFTGYSRGGSMAISLVNLIWAVGLTRAAEDGAVAREAMEVYGAREGYAGGRRAEFSRQFLSHHPLIDLVAVFDPVGALGWPLPNRLARVRFGQHDFSLRGNVRRYHALLALDEHRFMFRPVIQTGRHAAQEVSQVWCPGCHGDVGGGSDQPLSRVTLHLMLQVFEESGWPLTGSDKSIRNGDGLRPDVITSSWRFPHKLFPYEDRQVAESSIVAGECLAPLTKRWAVDHPVTVPPTPCWKNVKEMVV